MRNLNEKQSYDTDLTTTTHHLQLQQRLKTLNEANLKQSSYVEELENKLNVSLNYFH